MATAAYQPEPAAAAAARRFVRDTLRSWELAGRSGDHDPLVDDAVLLTSELVTNAVLHAGTPVQVTCRLIGSEPDGAVEIAVLDRQPSRLSPDLPPTAAEASERTNGRGLQLPFQLASVWGVTYARTAKAVWFRIGLTGRGTAASRGSPAVSGPGPTEVTAAVPEAAPLPDAAQARCDPGPAGFDELLVSTVETARDAIGADTAYLLHEGGHGEPGVRAAAAGRRDHGGRAGASLSASAAKELATGALSLVTVPLMVDGRVTGVLAAAAAEPGRFTENDATRLQDLADRSAPVLERARLSAAGLVV